MARATRYIIPDLPHHAIQRGNNRQDIFFDKADKLYFLSKLKEISTEEKVLIASYVLMTNHIHILLYPAKSDGLIKVMKGVAQNYTQYINRKYNRSGKLWENRYKLHIVDPEYEWVVARYIENNPLRARMIKRVEDYEYSSAKTNLLGVNSDIITKDIIQTRKKAYREFFYDSDSTTKEHVNKIAEIIQQEKALGSAKFINWLEEKLKVCFKVKKRGRPTKIKYLYPKIK